MLIENVFSLTNIMAMERQCLDHLEFDLVVSEDEVEFAVGAMTRFFASPTPHMLKPTSVRLDEEMESWLHGIPHGNMIPMTADISTQWFDSPQPSFQYLCSRRASAPAILDHQDQPAIYGAPSSYAAFPSDVSDGASSYPNTPVGGAGAELEFALDEMYQEVALDNCGSGVFTAEAMDMQFPVLLRYPELAMDEEYDSHLFARGRSTHSKPLGESGSMAYNWRPVASYAERESFAPPAPWMEHS